MPNLKTLTKKLRQKIVSYLYLLPSISSNLTFCLAIHIFSKTRFSRHINFISHQKVISQGFCSNFHASTFSDVSNFNQKYLHEIQRTQNTVFTPYHEKYDQRPLLKTERTEQANYRMSLSTFSCMSFSLTSIYQHQNPGSQLQTLQPFRTN